MIPQAIEDAAQEIKLQQQLKDVRDRSDEKSVQQYGVARGFLRRWSDSQSLKVLDSWAGKFQNEINAMAKAKKPAAEIKAKIEEYVKVIESKHREQIDQDKARLSKKLDEAEAEWKSSHTLELTDMMKLEARYKALSKAQLRKRYNEYALSQEPEELVNWQPYELDLLIGAMESRNDQGLAIDAAVLKAEREEKHSEQPWIYSPKGLEVMYEGMMTLAAPGTFNLRVEGKVVPFRYSELLTHPYEAR